MSIWCSWEHIGTDPNDWREVNEDGTTGALISKRAERGDVLSYANGFSSHHPDLSGEYERPAVVALAHIAPWCVPGHDQQNADYTCTGCGDDHEGGPAAVGPWLRLEVAAPETLNFWTKDDHGNPTVEGKGATVVLSEEAVRSLRDDLTRWLDAAKVRPLAPTTGAQGDAQVTAVQKIPHPDPARPSERKERP